VAISQLVTFLFRDLHGVNDVRQAETHTAARSPHEVETTAEKLKDINCQALIKFWQN
jgi:hypothetical protein